MLVRAKRTHYTDTLRVEGEQWEYEGKLYEHIEPVKVKAVGKAKPLDTDDGAEDR